MSVYFVRHGESLGNRDGYMMGQDDIELTDTGREQAKDVADKLKDLDIDLIVSSPLKRAFETAKIIAEGIEYDGEVIDDDRLKERNMGKWQGQPSKEFHAKLAEVSEEEFQEIGAMENLESLRDRAIEFTGWLEKRPEVNILVVGHHAYSKMLRTVIDDVDNYNNAFKALLPRIETGEFVKLKLGQES